MKCFIRNWSFIDKENRNGLVKTSSLKNKRLPRRKLRIMNRQLFRLSLCWNETLWKRFQKLVFFFSLLSLLPWFRQAGKVKWEKTPSYICSNKPSCHSFFEFINTIDFVDCVYLKPSLVLYSYKAFTWISFSYITVSLTNCCSIIQTVLDLLQDLY